MELSLFSGFLNKMEDDFLNDKSDFFKELVRRSREPRGPVLPDESVKSSLGIGNNNCELPALPNKKFRIIRDTKWCNEPSIEKDKYGRSVCKYHKDKLATSKSVISGNIGQKQSYVKNPIPGWMRPYTCIPQKIIKGKKLDIYAKMVLIYIWMCFDSKDFTAFPGEKLMSEDLGISRNTIVKAIKKLKDMGTLVVTQEKYDKTGQFKHNVYKLNIGK